MQNHNEIDKIYNISHKLMLTVIYCVVCVYHDRETAGGVGQSCKICKTPSQQTSESSNPDATAEPSTKKRRTALVGHYRAAAQNPDASGEPSKQLSRYISLYQL